jgi:uncharacterized membrane protein
MMRNLAVILGLLLLPYLALVPSARFGTVARAGWRCVGICVYGYWAFRQNRGDGANASALVPIRVSLIYLTGILELVGAVAILTPSVSRYAGVALCIFLLVILPSNVYAAFQRVDFGGHGAGPIYLLLRVPLQLLLIGWIYWFAIRQILMTKILVLGGGIPGPVGAISLYAGLMACRKQLRTPKMPQLDFLRRQASAARNFVL